MGYLISRAALAIILAGSLATTARAQTFPADDSVIRNIWKEATDSSQLEMLAHHLFDVIGPRLVGTPQMQRAHDWVVETYSGWGISAKNEQWGKWRGWARGVTHIDLLEPRVRTLEGTMLAWSPGTDDDGITSGLVILAACPDSLAFQRWLPAVKGKLVLISQPQPTGRPDKNWEEFGLKESFDSLKSLRKRMSDEWDLRVKHSGFKADTLPNILERAGAAGVLTSHWSLGWGVDKIFGCKTKRIPVVDVSLEDYNLLFRLVEHGDGPVVRVIAQAHFTAAMPTMNTIGEIRGREKPDEYVMLSAHLDSWDGSSGATDNGSGTILMMEVMRILHKYYPSPKRTILVGHWGSEEEGLNGSRAFVKDHPEIVAKLQALFNQDNGTGRVATIGAQGFIDAGEHLARWMSRIPSQVTSGVKLDFPGVPSGGGSDNASFVAAGAPGFGLYATPWDYFIYTWHTNRDTYDKLVFDDLRNNVILTACLAYLASEDPQFISREKRVMPTDAITGHPQSWPEVKEPQRAGGLN